MIDLSLIVANGVKTEVLMAKSARASRVVSKATVSMAKAAMQEMTDDFESRNFSIVNTSDMERQMRADEKAISDLEQKHRNAPPSIYDGTNLAELIEEEKASLPENELSFIEEQAFTIGCFGIAGIRRTAKAISIILPDKTVYRFGGNDMVVDILPPTIKMDGTIRLDRFGKTAGLAFVNVNGKKLTTVIRCTSRIWLGKVVPIGTKPEGIDLSK